MNLDIRLPIGILFSLIGVLLTGHGLTSDPAIYRRSLGWNVNLGWGLVLLAFGALMLALARRKPRRVAGPRTAELPNDPNENESPES